MKNYPQEGNAITVTVTHPTTPASGDPCRLGELVGVAADNEAADGKTVVMFSGVVDISVKGVDGAGNSAVAVGDRLYYVDADTPPVSKKNTGRPVGFALEAVTSGATDTINVVLKTF